MTFAQIFEKTRYAFNHDEVYELLIGKNDYIFQAPMYPVSIPTCSEFVFRDGIYPLYKKLDSKAQKMMLDKLTLALQKMMRSENEIDVWWALSLLYGQKLSEAMFKTSPFFIADKLLKESVPFLLSQREKLKHTHVYLGSQAPDGLWEDVLRYNMLLAQKFGFKLLEG